MKQTKLKAVLAAALAGGRRLGDKPPYRTTTI